MPGRITPLVNDEFYHIYNRGSEKRDIFTQPKDYKRFQKTLNYYQFLGTKPSFSKFTKSSINSFKPDLTNKIVEIICYCLMPNHFHFLVKQLRDNGISIFISQLSNSYTKYFNTKYTRVGALFQGTFKSVHINSDEQLIHVSRYIHLNPIVSGLVKNLEDYCWSSYSEYIKPIDTFCSVYEILELFTPNERERYKEFVEAQIDYGTKLEQIKHQLIDINEDH